MPTGIEEAIAGIVGAITSAVIWVNSLPMEFKYIFFLASLSLDAGIIGIIGSLAPFAQNGAFGSIFSYFIATVFNIQGFSVSSFELLILFTLLPVILFLLKHGRQNINI